MAMEEIAAADVAGIQAGISNGGGGCSGRECGAEGSGSCSTCISDDHCRGKVGRPPRLLTRRPPPDGVQRELAEGDLKHDMEWDSPEFKCG